MRRHGLQLGKPSTNQPLGGALTPSEEQKGGWETLRCDIGRWSRVRGMNKLDVCDAVKGKHTDRA